MSPSGQSEIEERLKEALEQAKAEYESAKQQCSHLQVYAADLGKTHPDGALAYRLAVRKLAFVTQQYSSALVRFNRFILDGKPPEVE